MAYIFMTALVVAIVYLIMQKKDGWGWLVFILLASGGNSSEPSKEHLNKIKTLQTENRQLKQQLSKSKDSKGTVVGKTSDKESEWAKKDKAW